MKIKSVFLTFFVAALQIFESVQDCRTVTEANGVANYICDTIQDLERQGNPNLLNVTITNGQLFTRSLASKPSLSITLSEDMGFTDQIIDYIKDLSNLWENDNELRTLTVNTFGNLPLKHLKLTQGQLTYIEPRAFSQMSDLIQIYIVNNKLRSVDVGVFNNLNLDTLALSNNRINVLQRGSLFNMRNLRHLHLDKNLISNFQSDALMNYKSQLESLYLQSNSIKVIDRSTFKGFNNLRILDLSDNRIDKIINYSFETLLKLESLALANNFLRDLNTEILPLNGFQYLSKLNLGNNDLSYLTTAVLEKIRHVKYISVGGNPWQCPCLNLILDWIGNHNINQVCDKDYFKGLRPVCVAGRNNEETCHYNNINEDSYKYIEENNRSNITGTCVI